jgi:putative hydrolase of the HAD superfamily
VHVTTLFFDVGGVLLTNGWDRHGRRRAAERFGLDYDELTERHDFVAHSFETGRMDIEEYLRRTVFHRPRDFGSGAFISAMKSESAELPGSLELMAELAAGGLSLATLNNESRMLNDYRIERFGLRRFFRSFLSSCYVGFKKPEPELYRLAFAVTQARPEEALFIDDRALNVECAADEGLPGLHFEGIGQLRRDLAARGILPLS